MKVSDGQILPVMTDLLAVPECLIFSYLIYIFNVWSVSINHRFVPAQDVPAALPQTWPGVFPCVQSMERYCMHKFYPPV